VEFLGIEDLFNSLKSGIAENKIEEKTIRLEIWWAYNDRKRNNDELRWKENCLALLKLLDYSDINQRIMVAEINRNLGDFEKCISIISYR